MHGAPFRASRAADAEAGQHATFGERVEGCALLGQQNRIAHRDGDDIDPELDASRATSDRCQRGQALENRGAADQPIALPERIDAALFAQIHPAPESGDAVEREFHEADSGCDRAGHGFSS
jgi:hypothetical protein